MFLLLTFLLISCSNSNDIDEVNEEENENIDHKPESNEPIVDETEIEDNGSEKQEPIDIFEMTDEEIKENFPETQIQTTKVGRSSFIMITEIDASTETNKEIVQTLTQFDAVDTGDGAVLTLPEGILFDFDSDELRSEADKAIEQLTQVIETTDEDVTIVGHTDSQGKEDYNQELSEQRAEAVREALIEFGIERERLIAEGMGESEPVAENAHSDGSDNPEGRQENRRVEVTVHGFNQ